jgi:hypothetical protein
MNKPNYRIYDRTGGGTTEDIYAESLADAIEQGREWIEDGDWSGVGAENADENGETTYRTIELECCVREIVLDDNGETDDDETDDGDYWNCSGEYSDQLPECEAPDSDFGLDERDDEGHVWESPYSLVGGLRENPGVWGGSGTSMSFESVCARCGKYRREYEPGSQRNPDEALREITIRDRDEESEAWLKERHEDGGWIPDWLAEMLDCAPTVRYTSEEAAAWVEERGDDDDLDEDDLEHVFAATFERRADDRDREEGLWSHLCAAL